MDLIDHAEERIVAVRHAPVNPWPKRITLAVLVVLLSTSGFLFSLFSTDTWYADLESDRDRLLAELEVEKSTTQALRREIATVKTGAIVDRKAAAVVRTELRDYQTDIAKLKESIQFYENLMNPKAGQVGLDAYQFAVYPTDETDVYRFRLVMQQLGTGQRTTSAQVDATVVGLLAEEETHLALSDIVVAPDSWPSKFSFRYYYNAEGKLRLPEGFEPKRITVALKAPKKSSKTFEFNWQVMEN